MKSGSFSITALNFGFFRLDGGAMFGSVPKNIWSKLISVDDENCISLASRSLLIEKDNRVILIDVGLGEKWAQKSKDIFAIKNFSFEELKLDPTRITDVVLTHLHFDHAGGISRFKPGTADSVELIYPQATVHLQKTNFLNAKVPSVRERASYLKENIDCLNCAKLCLAEGSGEILPQIFVHLVNGHTRGQQWIEIITEADRFFFATDVVPTSRHLPLPYTMGYDICTETTLSEKKDLLERAVKEDAIVVFQHDPDIAAARITVNQKGHFAMREQVLL